MADRMPPPLDHASIVQTDDHRSAWMVLDQAFPQLISAIGVVTLLSTDAHAEPYQIDAADLAVGLLSEVKTAVHQAQKKTSAATHADAPIADAKSVLSRLREFDDLLQNFGSQVLALRDRTPVISELDAQLSVTGACIEMAHKALGHASTGFAKLA